MSHYQGIIDQLNRFLKRHYTKVLMGGVLLFLSLGLLYFLLTLALEYWLWLGSAGRLLLLLAFVAVEGFLLYRYILVPLFYLFKVKRGLTHKEASKIIGNHFPEVDDKLYNLLDLAEDHERSELLEASIEQRSASMSNFNFVQAVNFKENLKYVKYLAIPVVILLLLGLTGALGAFMGSYERVVHYNTAYEPPAPFQFKLLSPKLRVLESESKTIQVATEGELRPDQVYLEVNGEQLAMQEHNGIYTYTIAPPQQSLEFRFVGGEVISRPYNLEALSVPTIQDFTLALQYPKYTNRNNNVLTGTGNATVPEGTTAIWKVRAQHTDAVQLVASDTVLAFGKEAGEYGLAQKVFHDLDYTLTTSNSNVSQFESLAFALKVVKDQYPKIKVVEVQDSLQPDVRYFSGDASDDYGVANIQLFCYPIGNPASVQKVQIKQNGDNIERFYYTFPSDLQLEKGVPYELYFGVTDNDAIHGGKLTKSQVFGYALQTDGEREHMDLEIQKNLIQDLGKSFEGYEEQKKQLQELERMQLEERQLDFGDKQKLKDFVKRQERQESMMQKFSEQLQEKLEDKQDQGPLDNLLEERLERQRIQAEKNQKLLDELNKVADKINKDELGKRLEQLAKNQNSNQRSLEQLLELTKRFYVTEKASQLSESLRKLADKQEQESKSASEDPTKTQEQLNTDFGQLAKELEELLKDNGRLQKPISLDVDKEDSEGVQQDQLDALNELKKEQQESKPNQDSKASKKQKSAAEKMKSISDSLLASSSGGGSSISEDAEMLRQILDNLITFSFKEEALYNTIARLDPDAPQLMGNIKKQEELKELFEHVDDSLFALSLRRAELSDLVNDQIAEVYYNIDKAQENLAESRTYQGASYQQYVLTASNTLADFLADILENMQASMNSGSGQGQGKDFQLPDIIQSQQELQERMGQGKGQQKSGSSSQGQQSGQQAGQQQGSGKDGEGKENGSQGNKGKDGQGGEQGRQGQQGQSGQNGNQGQNGTGGEGGSDGQSGMSEAELSEVYEIYKEQQRIRQELEKQLQDMMNQGDQNLAKKLLQQMEDFAEDLLQNGITYRTQQKANNIQHQLLRLENATLKQGQRKERESRSNNMEFTNPILTPPDQLQDRGSDVEILNRQALPLQPRYSDRVKQYFQNDD